MLISRSLVFAICVAALSAPALALNPQPFPPPSALGTLDDGQHFKVVGGVVFLIDASNVAHRAPAGSYKLKTGESIRVLSTGRLSAETLRTLHGAGMDGELNPQPFPPPAPASKTESRH